MKLKLPKLISVQLQAFSLYQGEPNAGFICSEGVTCLVGANGVGKSTLLNAISYALTGIVPDPSRSFKSFDEYYARCLPYANRYFSGRIVESDRDTASITLTFECASKFYRITRKLFDAGELEEFVTAESLEALNATQDNPAITRRDKQLSFEQLICQDSGFSSFSQFACFQHFVCTFDEKRTLLLYSNKLVEQVLNTVFLLEPALAVEIDALRRSEEKYDSQVRNIQWEITKNLKRINEAKIRADSMSDWQSELAELEGVYKELQTAHSERSILRDNTRGKLDDLTLELAQLSAKEATLRDEFSRVMSSVSQVRPDVREQPATIKMLNDGLCFLCGVHSESLKQKAIKLANSNQCPVCESTLPDSNTVDDQLLASLQELDKELSQTRKATRDTANALLREQDEVKVLDRSVIEIQEQIHEFEAKSLTTLSALRNSLSSPTEPNAVDAAEDQQLIQILQAEKTSAEKSRTEVRERLSELRRKLRTQFLELEDKFVPLFRELAHTFLGVDIGIRLDDSGSDTVRLIISVRGSNRREEFALSESQKFFLDIAFRMSLLQFVSTDNPPSTLILDTPEGSLDIAYEKRAGVMLASFVSRSNRVLMSANLNSSHLLLALARECGESKMSLIPIMNWAVLSSVQQEESALFDDAMHQIVEALSQAQ
ncbi:MAG: AAA family ATPase [Fimbriimonadaceae bacterium]|nr:MAG: AAA family ATPase [Fimbriimonadaceae bacterium]